uniref:BRCT domain-containing protein n=1 Tax=Plectus sambesii TaxID=2011161 RepID=A0A914VV13_9BILA
RFQKKRPLSPVDVVQSPTPNDSSISMGPVPAENLRRSRRHVAVNTSNDVKESSPSAVKTRRVARRHTIANIRFPQSPTQLLVNRVDQLNIGVAVPATKDPEAVTEKVVEKQAAIPETQLKSPNKQPTTSKARDSSESPLLCEPFEDRAKKGVTMKRRRLGKSEMYRLYAETVETPADADVRRVLNESRRQARGSGVYAVKTSSKLLNQLQRGLPSSEEFVDRTRSRIRQRRRSSRKPTSSLVLTSLGTNERNTLLPIIKKLGGYNAAMQVDGSTSHIICKDRRRTLNLLKGVVRGCWIVNDEWVYRSLEMGSWLPEEDFEMADWAPAIKKRRVSADQASTLFAGVRSFYIAPDCNPSVTDLTDLITHSGGKIVPMPRASVFILANRTTLTDRFLRYNGVKAVSEKWVLDSIMMDEIQPFDSYPVL